MPASSSVVDRRLMELEQVVAETRHEAGTRCADLGLTLSRDTDLRYVAAFLTGGTVDPFPNLGGDDERLAGMLEWVGSYPRILFEAYDPPVRQRFSIAHELGHYYLHARDRSSVHRRCSQARVDRDLPLEPGMLDVEDEADAFAGAFLLPADELTTDLAHFGICVAFLAERYLVSEATVRRRLRTLQQLQP